MIPTDSQAQEAKDLMGDVHGRWYPFSATAETIVCLEKQGLPDHLKQLPSIETPMTLQALLMDLEDVGEASDFPSTSIKLVHKKCKHIHILTHTTMTMVPRLSYGMSLVSCMW